MPSGGSRRYGLPWLIAAAALPTLVWQLPFGSYALLPFSVLSVWFHEMGHGLTALLLGGRFESLLLYTDGGITSCGAVHGGRAGAALVSAGGLLGPPAAGFLFLVASVRPLPARAALAALGGVMLASVLLWVRTLYGDVAVALIGLGVLLAAWRGSADIQALLAKLIGVQACIASYRSRHYLFSSGAVIGGHPIHSDTAQIAQQLFLPFWFWGAVLFAASLALLAGGVYLSTRPEEER